MDLILRGKWRSEGSDRTTLNFKEGGMLEYTIPGADKDQIIFLTYRIEGSVLITDQPSHPREERTTFQLTPDGKLRLAYGGEEGVYAKVSNPARP
jgi:hypothetical protein